jgi:hypothetical protein
VNNDLERMWKESVVGSTNLAGLRKTQKPPEYETEVLLIQPQWSIKSLF